MKQDIIIINVVFISCLQSLCCNHFPSGQPFYHQKKSKLKHTFEKLVGLCLNSLCLFFLKCRYFNSFFFTLRHFNFNFFNFLLRKKPSGHKIRGLNYPGQGRAVTIFQSRSQFIFQFNLPQKIVSICNKNYHFSGLKCINLLPPFAIHDISCF